MYYTITAKEEIMAYNGNRTPNYRSQTPREKITFDFFTDGRLNIEWLDEKARDLAEARLGDKYNGVNYSQIRQFYDEFVTLKAMPFSGEEFTQRVVPLLKLLKAKITNRHNRKLLDREGNFKAFIYALVDAVKTREDLMNMAMIFEAVVGYFPKTK